MECKLTARFCVPTIMPTAHSSLVNLADYVKFFIERGFVGLYLQSLLGNRAPISLPI
jgi:hypothetical protein